MPRRQPGLDGDLAQGRPVPPPEPPEQVDKLPCRARRESGLTSLIPHD